MLNQDRIQTETFPTFCTFAGLLPSVNLLMDAALTATPESLPTVFTFKGLLPSVDSLVLSKFRVVTEGFPTALTFVGFLSTMDTGEKFSELILYLPLRKLWRKNCPQCYMNLCQPRIQALPEVKQQSLKWAKGTGFSSTQQSSKNQSTTLINPHPPKAASFGFTVPYLTLWSVGQTPPVRMPV